MDISEKTDVAVQNPDVLARLRQSFPDGMPVAKPAWPERIISSPISRAYGLQ